MSLPSEDEKGQAISAFLENNSSIDNELRIFIGSFSETVYSDLHNEGPNSVHCVLAHHWLTLLQMSRKTNQQQDST